jgi:hypothetical protein
MKKRTTMKTSNKIKEKFIFLKPDKNKVTVTCCLPVSIYNGFMKQCLTKKMDMHTMLDHIVMTFQADFDDISYFYRGEQPKTLADKATAIFKGREERTFQTFQITTKTYEKIKLYKNIYNLTKTDILKRFIVKYIRSGELDAF